MVIVLKSLVLLSIVLVIANDIMFNRRRHIALKILEFIVCISIIVYVFVDASNYIATKDEIVSDVKNSELFGSEMTIYNLDGTTEETTVGKFMYDSFVQTVFDNEVDTESQEYIEGNVVIVFMAVILLTYWILLLVLFEKEETLGYKVVAEEEIFEKYNPMVAGCIAQNRNIMCRDVIGVFLNLVNKDKVKIRFVPDQSVKEIGYRYMISENSECKTRLDMIENEIFDWIFEEVPKFEKGIYNVDYISRNQDGIIEIVFIKRIEELSANEDTFARLKELNRTVKKRLNNMGANKEAVPGLIKLLNNMLVTINIFLVVNHIMSNGITMSVTNLDVLYTMFIVVFAVSLLPVVYVVSLICFEFIRIYFKSLQQITEGYTGRRLIAKSISIVFATVILMVIYSVFAKDVYIIYDILLTGITCLIIFTDDYMLKHDYKILNDYYNIKRIENKISEYSLMKEENIEYIKLWNEYYTYAIAFGIPITVKNQIDVPYEYTSILSKGNLEGIYYVFKAYFEVMWDMEFYDKKSMINIFKILK